MHVDRESEQPCITVDYDLRTKFQMFTLLICGVICVVLIIDLMLSPPDDKTVLFMGYTVNIYVISLEVVYGTEALMLLLISKIIRDTFFEFLFIDRIAKVCRRIRPKNNKVKTVRIQSIFINK
uniref:G_PROTEIN_RECEP_F1_2 domain-containing protein n=1 Tax=Panagrellus redivivus TaxID=6233 RepID=A0A7E4WCK0_PANRE